MLRRLYDLTNRIMTENRKTKTEVKKVLLGFSPLPNMHLSLVVLGGLTGGVVFVLGGRTEGVVLVLGGEQVETPSSPDEGKVMKPTCLLLVMLQIHSL